MATTMCLHLCMVIGTTMSCLCTAMHVCTSILMHQSLFHGIPLGRPAMVVVPDGARPLPTSMATMITIMIMPGTMITVDLRLFVLVVVPRGACY